MKRVFIATGIIAVAGGLATATLGSSCDTVCTMEANPSVVVQIKDLNNDATAPKFVTADEVWYEFTDESTGKTETKRAECLDDECTEWILGYELPGTYEIHANVCGQQYDGSAVVGMTDDGCHVATEWVELDVDSSTCPQTAPQAEVPIGAVPPVTCTLESRPSVLVDVQARIGDQTMPIPTDKVFYSWSGDTAGGELPGLCLNEECSSFAAGREQEGTFVVGAEVCGKAVTAEVEVGKTEDGCHVETESVVLTPDLDACKTPLEFTAPPAPTSCTLEARPSAFVFPVTDGGDVWIPHPTEQLWFEHGDTRHEAYCAEEAENGKCAWWITGYELDGRIKAFTESCGAEQSVSFSVDKTEDGCHVQTRYVPVFVDTSRCISIAPPSGSPPPPPTPSPTK